MESQPDGATEPGRVELRGSTSATVKAVLAGALLLSIGGLVQLPNLLENGGSAGVVVAVAAVVGLVVAIGVRVRRQRGDVVAADENGVRIRSRRFGEQEIAWSELRDVGWVTAPRMQKSVTGLAVRRREGGAYDPGGRHIPGWVAMPVGVDEAKIAALRELVEQAGVPWQEYRPTDVMEPPRR